MLLIEAAMYVIANTFIFHSSLMFKDVAQDMSSTLKLFCMIYTLNVVTSHVDDVTYYVF